MPTKTRPADFYGHLTAQQRTAIRKAVFGQPVEGMHKEIARQAKRYGLAREIIVRSLPPIHQQVARGEQMHPVVQAALVTAGQAADYHLVR